MSFGMYDTYYNPYTYAYSYPGSAGVNHAITLIGWDDNYSRENFNSAAMLLQTGHGLPETAGEMTGEKPVIFIFPMRINAIIIL